MMFRQLFVVSSLLVLGIITSEGCARRRAPASASSPIEQDSLRGVVSVVGTTFERRIVLLSGGRATSLAATTGDSAALSRLGAVEVVVRGRAEGGTFHVDSFTAERVDGAPVVDGVLIRDGERLVLVTSTGRILLGNPPGAFQRMVGARVWVGGPLDTGPNNYGVIVPAR